MKSNTKYFMQVDFNSVQILGLNAASLLSYLIFKSDNTNKVEVTYREIQRTLALGEKLVSKAEHVLKDKDLISTSKNIEGRKIWILNEENIDKLITSTSSNLTSSGSNLTSSGSNLTSSGSNLTSSGSMLKQEIINNKQYNNPFNEQAHSSSQQAVQQESESILDKLAREAWAPHQDINSITVDIFDNASTVKTKAKTVRKTRKAKSSTPDIQPKWFAFLEFIKNEFSILYPKYRNKAKTIEASLEFALDNDNAHLDEQAILDIVDKIKKHYIVYCQDNDYAVGPVRYINDMIWTVDVKGLEQSISNEEKYKFNGWD